MFVILLLMDVITLFIFLFNDYLPLFYVFSGIIIPLVKGGFFFLISQDLLSALDVLSGILMILFYLGVFSQAIWWIIIGYFFFKILMSLSAFA